MASEYVGRWLLTPDGAVKGSLRLEDGIVAEVCHGVVERAPENAIVLPAFVNAHVHIGDSVAYPAPRGSVRDLVGPPDGYKHRALRSADRSRKIAAMRASAELMQSTGTSAFADFREEGVEGIRAIEEALKGELPRAVILGRPSETDFTDAEAASILAACDGFGVSGPSDWQSDSLVRLAGAARRAGKMFSLHVSEAEREDIDAVIGLRPSFIIHMTKASESDLRSCAENGIPVVVCSRSNEFFGMAPDIPRMLRLGVEVALGTDNCMINQPDMIEEIKASYRIAKAKGDISPLEIVKLATFGGRKVLNAKGKITTEITERGDLMVIRLRGGDPLLDLATSASSADIQAIVKGGKLRRA